MKAYMFEILRKALVATTGRGYDRTPAINDLHHKLAYRLHKMLPFFRIRGVQKISVPGLPDKFIYVRAEDGGVAHQFIMYHQYEPFETEIVRQELKPGMKVYNIGANVGYYVLVASECVGTNGIVCGFEPAPSNLFLLHKMVQENHLANVRIFGAALGDRDGIAGLALSESNSGDHQLRDYPDREQVPVPIHSVDGLCARGVPEPDVILMDVQGSELEVLRGMRGYIRSGKPSIIFTEFAPKTLNEREENGAKEFLDLLTSNGYSLTILDEKQKRLIPTTTEELLRDTVGYEEKNLLCKR